MVIHVIFESNKLIRIKKWKYQKYKTKKSTIQIDMKIDFYQSLLNINRKIGYMDIP